MNIDTIIERVENLREPDRALDAELHCVLFRPKQRADDLRYFRVPHGSMDHMEMCAPGTYWLKERSGQSLRTAPHYTAEFASDRLLTLLYAIKAEHDDGLLAKNGSQAGNE